jgi:hypothetical protein
VAALGGRVVAQLLLSLGGELFEPDDVTLRNPTALRIEIASSGVSTVWSPSSRTASSLSAGGPPAFRRADVLRDVDAALDGGNKGVLHAAQPDGILAALLAGPGFMSQDSIVVGNAPEESQDAIFVDHGLPAPAGDAGRELPMRAGDARELVKVNLPGGSLPPDPADGIIIKEQPAAGRYPPG